MNLPEQNFIVHRTLPSYKKHGKKHLPLVLFMPLPMNEQLWGIKEDTLFCTYITTGVIPRIRKGNIVRVELFLSGTEIEQPNQETKFRYFLLIRKIEKVG